MTAAFDRIAEVYDAQWTHTAIGRAQREQVWRQIDGLFREGERVLDIGCGTGEDAAHLAERGVRVHAMDASPAMIQQASRHGSFTAEVRRAEDVWAVRHEAAFDGAISNFGALNCVEDLAEFSYRLASVIRPGGRVAICLIGKFCAWETLHYAAALQWRKACRRASGTVASSLGVTVRYASVHDVARAFSPMFELRRWTGIGLFVPPSYVALKNGSVGRLRGLDRLLAGVPLLRGMADHRLLVFVRK